MLLRAKEGAEEVNEEEAGDNEEHAVDAVAFGLERRDAKGFGMDGIFH